jgi:hypothetical protein
MSNIALFIRDSVNRCSEPLSPNGNHEYRPCLPASAGNLHARAHEQLVYLVEDTSNKPISRNSRVCLSLVSEPSKVEFPQSPNLPRVDFMSFPTLQGQLSSVPGNANVWNEYA